MKENEVSVLDQYDIDIKSTRRIRGAILCATNQGLFVLRELMISEKRIPMLHKLYVHMMENGCDRVDAVIENKEHELFSTSEDGIKYVVKRWYDGKECDIRKEQKILQNCIKSCEDPLILERNQRPLLWKARICERSTAGITVR